MTNRSIAWVIEYVPAGASIAILVFTLFRFDLPWEVFLSLATVLFSASGISAVAVRWGLSKVPGDVAAAMVGFLIGLITSSFADLMNSGPTRIVKAVGLVLSFTSAVLVWRISQRHAEGSPASTHTNGVAD